MDTDKIVGNYFLQLSEIQGAQPLKSLAHPPTPWTKLPYCFGPHLNNFRSTEAIIEFCHGTRDIGAFEGSNLYKRVCPSIRPSVGPSVGSSVGTSVCS